jgi:hypothetical protein
MACERKEFVAVRLQITCELLPNLLMASSFRLSLVSDMAAQ